MEGPSLVILKETVKNLRGKTILEASGLASLGYEALPGQKIVAFKTWGKHFLVVLKTTTLRIHFLMFGSYRINETKDRRPSLHLALSDSTDLNFYTCSVREIAGNLEEVYDWSADVMSAVWDPGKARKKLKAQPELNVGDALLDQNKFAGVGNIIKNEVLFRIRIHPESVIGALPPRKLTALVAEAKNYSFDFYHWKKRFELKKHWLIHTKKTCPRCHLPSTKRYTGKTKRRSFFCENCQRLYQ